MACGRLLDSPRVQDGGTPALTRNLQEGLDHSLTRNEALVQALATQDLSLPRRHARPVLATVLNGHGRRVCWPTRSYGLDRVRQLDVQPARHAGDVRRDAVRRRGAGELRAACAATRSAEQELTDGTAEDAPRRARSSPATAG